MPLSRDQIIEAVAELREVHDTERSRLDLIHRYLRDDPKERRLAGIPSGAPDDVVRLARLSRVNLLKYIVNARVQNMYVDGFQTPTSADNLDQWETWQRNRFDARQIGVHRAGLSFGASYVTVLPGEPVPVMRGASPRKLTVAYGADDDWPAVALEHRRGDLWRLIDSEAVYELRGGEVSELVLVGEPMMHGATFEGEPVCPVVRFRDTDDLDDPIRGIVEPFFPLQDQINITSFGLQVAQHFGAWRQRWVIGWLAENEEQALKMGADRLMMFEDSPQDVTVGEFAQTDLRGYIESREATIRHLATVSQTPVHELMGQFINLSAEALEAARASHQAAIDENRIMAGESWEQALNLAGEMSGQSPEAMASVLWRDTRVRSLTEAAEAFGKLVTELGVPPRELWSRIPGVPQHEVERWKAAADRGDAFADLEALLDRQAAGTPPAPAPPPAM
ncbi:MAG: phage portal protein [Actinobacteria bacterium]|nr:phage portal protein [Actinomycetota bacterium]